MRKKNGYDGPERRTQLVKRALYELLHNLGAVLNKPTSKIYLAIIATCFLAIWFRVGWVIFYDYQPFIVHSPTLLVMNQDHEVCQGDKLIIRADTEKTEPIETLVSTELVNTYSYTLTAYLSDREMGRKWIQKKIHIHSQAEPGRYRIFRTFKTKVSDFPEHYVKVERWSEWFTVVHCKHPGGHPINEGEETIR